MWKAAKVQALPPPKRQRRLRGKLQPPVARMRCISSYLEFARARCSMQGSELVAAARCSVHCEWTVYWTPSLCRGRIARLLSSDALVSGVAAQALLSSSNRSQSSCRPADAPRDEQQQPGPQRTPPRLLSGACARRITLPVTLIVFGLEQPNYWN